VLPTWWRRAGRVGWDRSLAIARQVVDSMLPKDTPRAARSDLRELVGGAIEDRTFPREAITRTVEQVLGRKAGCAADELVNQRASQIIDGMWSMVVAMSRYDQLTDGMFLEARVRLAPIILSYVQQWPLLASDPVNGHTFEKPTWEFFMNHSCQQLLVGLGLELLAADDGRSLGPVVLRQSMPLYKALEGIPLR
jgi:hypothetical protein